MSLLKRRLVIVVLVFVFVRIHCSQLYGNTHVGGNITQDSTWALSGSPYIFDSDVTVYNNACLIVEPEVTLELSNGHLYIGSGSSSGQIQANSVTFVGKGMYRKVKIDNSGGTITNCMLDSVYIWLENSSPTITNNVITGNGYPIYFRGICSPTISGNDLAGNTYEGIMIGSVIETDYTLKNYSLPYYLSGYAVTGNSITVNNNATLTIESGNTLEFVTGGIGAYENSFVNANSVTFVGKGMYRKVKIDNSGGTITNCMLDSVYIWLENSSPTITNNVITGNGTAISCQSDANPIINYNDIFNNSHYGVYNASASVTINAENNWWGASIGPFHSSNPSGTGDSVSDYVDFDPWSSVPNNINPGNITLDDIAITDNFIAISENEKHGIFQRIFDAVMGFSGPSTGTDVDIYLTFSDNSNIKSITGYFEAIDPAITLNPEHQFSKQPNGKYRCQFKTLNLSQMTIEIIKKILLYSIHTLGTGGLPVDIEFISPRMKLHKVTVEFIIGNDQVLTVDEELPRFNKSLSTQINDFWCSGLFNYDCGIYAACPVDFCVVDPSGNRLGKWNGQEYHNIPYSIYSDTTEPELCVILGDSTYNTVFQSTSSGQDSFHLIIEQSSVRNPNTDRKVTFPSIDICDSTEAYIDVGHTVSSFNLDIDYDGDTSIDTTISPSSDSTGDFTSPPAPTGLIASSDSGEVFLSWNANPEADGVNYYVIYRDTLSRPIDSISISLDTNFVDSTIISGNKHYYRITAVDSFGNTSDFSREVEIDYVGIDEKTLDTPIVYRLYPNYPNPFFSKTTIKYAIPLNTKVSLKIYNISGQLVRTLVLRTEDPGYKCIHWDGYDNKKKEIAGGIYFYRLETPDFVDTKKLILLK